MIAHEIILKKFIKAINTKLAEQGQQWVFIFDQFAKLFFDCNHA